MHKRSVFLFCWLIPAFMPADLLAQGTIRGRITDAATGQPLAAAQISAGSVAGTRFGSATDANGVYVIAGLPAGAQTISARRIGYVPQQRTVTVDASTSTTADFALSAATTTLEDVVVTGTATPTTVRALGTSVASIGASEIAAARSTTVDQAMQGKIAGAQITQNSGNPGGGGISVRLRGTSSIISGSEPLYIVDGVIVDNSSDQLIDLGARSNVQNRLADLDPNDIERVEIIRGAAAAALYGSRANNGVVQIFTKRGRAGGSTITLQTRYTTARLAKRLALNLSPTDAAGLPVTRYDYQNDIFTAGNQKETYLSFEGGSASTTYYFGASYNDEDGIIRGSSALRRSARLNVGQQLLPKLKLNLGGNFVQSKANFEPNGEQTTGVITALLFTPTTFSFYPVDGVYPKPPLGGAFANPLEVIDRWKAPQDVNRFIGSANALFSPASNLAIRYTVGYDGYQFEADQFIPRGSLASEPLGYTTAVLRDSRIVNNDGVLTLTTRAGSTVEFGTSAGFNFTNQRISTTTATARDLIPTGELVTGGATPAAGQSRFVLKTLGFYGQQTVTWRERLYLTGALRRDASSTFGPSERWQLYPKVSLSYVVSDEDYFKNSPLGGLFNSFRLRGALGYAGNQPSIANAYSRYDSYVKAVNSDRLGVVNSLILGNENLKPERQREYEFGADISLLSGRLGLELTGYNKLVTDALLFRPLPTSSGYLSRFDNIGEISNKGVELLVRSTNVQRPGLRWATTATYSRNRNVVSKLIVAPFTLGYANRVEEGKPVGFFYAELPQKNAAGGDSIDAAGLVVRSPVATRVSGQVGDPNPDWLGSLINEIDIGRRVRMRVLLDGSFGNDVLNFTRRILDTFATGGDTGRELLPVGDPNRLAPGFLRSRRFFFGLYVEDGTYVKLREISASVELGQMLANATRSKGLELTLSGRNLYTWTDYRGFDPEMNLFGQRTVERGNDFGTYPIPRTFTVGIRATY